jgi:thiamine biosynthesis protein ThiS
MKVLVNSTEWEVEEGTKLKEIVEKIREAKKYQPMTKILVKTTGKDNILFSLNGKLVKPDKHEETEIKEGDHIRLIHPGFGG